MAAESTLRITQRNFAGILLERVPEAREELDDHLDAYGELLLHLLAADLLHLATRLYHSGEPEELQRLLEFVDDCLSQGDAYVENAIQASFVESVGAYSEETPGFIASWPAGLLAERERQLNWSPRSESTPG